MNSQTLPGFETLTKEDFFNELHSLYPAAVDVFCKWIDEYKKRVDFREIFNADFYCEDAGHTTVAPKFHNLPLAFQAGILMQFSIENQDKFKVPLTLNPITPSVWRGDIIIFFRGYQNAN